jgi:shikimate kinase
MRSLIIAGPGGVGKTTAGRALSERLRLRLYELDAIRSRAPESDLSYTASRLDFERIVAREIPPDETFVLDVGGDTLFRAGANNDGRLAGLRRVVAERGCLVVLLDSDDDETIVSRYLQGGSKLPESLAIEVLRSWREHSQPYWAAVANASLDASDDLEHVVSALEHLVVNGALPAR